LDLELVVHLVLTDLTSDAGVDKSFDVVASVSLAQQIWQLGAGSVESNVPSCVDVKLLQVVPLRHVIHPQLSIQYLRTDSVIDTKMVPFYSATRLNKFNTSILSGKLLEAYPSITNAS